MSPEFNPTSIILCLSLKTVWYSKRQNTVESSTFGSEFVAMRIAKDLAIALRYKLRMFGIPIDGPADVFCDNQGVVKNTSLPESVLSKCPMEIAHCIAPIIDWYFCIPSASSRSEVSRLVAASSPSKQKNKKKDGNTAEEYTDDPLISMAIVAYLRKHKYDRRLALVFGKEVIDRHGDSVMTVLDENNNKGGQLQFVRPHQTVADKKELETNKLTLSPTKNHKKMIKNNNDDGDESEGDEHDEGESRDVMPSPTKKGGRPTILRQSSSFSDGKSVSGDDDDNESCASEQHGGKRPSLRKQVSFSEGDVSETKEIDCVERRPVLHQDRNRTI